MQLSPEQQSVIESSGNLRVDAVAGAGKTSTLLKYAQLRKNKGKTLYLAFNRLVKEEAKNRFKRAGINNVTCETAHSLAWKKVVRGKKIQIVSQWSSHNLSKRLGFKGADPLSRFALAHHVNQCFSCYCNHSSPKLDGNIYLGTISDPRVREHTQTMMDQILSHTARMWRAMNEGKMKITHDFYLKKYQLLSPRLSFEQLLFDEGQDASPVMLDIFLKQRGDKIIVGDSDQQIYGWRHAVNSLEVADFPKMSLSSSFRFGQEIADLAMGVLEWKKSVQPFLSRRILGAGNLPNCRGKACLARTNLALISRAIEWVFAGPKLKRIYFEGGISPYTRTEEGISLFDVLNLALNRESNIRDGFVRQMGDFGNLEEFALQTGNSGLKTMIGLVKEYKKDLPDILKVLKEKHVDEDMKDQADMIFSTVHRCKGLEYGKVYIEEDFMDLESIREASKRGQEEPAYLNRLKEEVNLLYVAITRAKHRVSIPSMYKVSSVSGSQHIRWRESSAKLALSA